MSINVNVSGNPVRIHRGKMVTANPDYAKEEFQKRRRIRLEQVRQQSKDIAENVRNKVRKEKDKQISDLEKKGEKELKKWQTRKLLQLQQQYRECLKDIGLGHSEAALEEESDNAMESRKENYDQVAKERGQRAIDKLQKQKHKEHSDKSTGLQKRRYNQTIESTRAKLVADLNKKKKNKSPFKKKKRKVSTDINISRRLSGGSDTESEALGMLNLSNSSSGSSSGSSTLKEVLKSTKKDVPPVLKESTEYTSTTEELNRQQGLMENQSSKEKLDRRRRISPPTRRTTRDEEVSRAVSIGYSVDTRISDRIKSRTILNNNCNCKPITEVPDIPPSTSAFRGRKALTIHSDQLSTSSPEKSVHPSNPKAKAMSSLEEDDPRNSGKNYSTSKQCCSNDGQEEIPNKPTVTLRTAPESSNQLKSFVQSSSGSQNKVQYYDHKNRFTKEYIADDSSVRKIPEDSVEVCPSTGSEVEFVEQMYKRDHEAQVRGQKALEKAKVHRDYRQMMQQLPVLQKQERIAAIPSNKPQFHMSEDRLKFTEKKKQNRMEDAYEKLFPKARVITIPSKNQKVRTSSTNLPYQTINVNENQPTLNVGSWDFDVQPKFTPDLAPKHVESNLIREATEKALGEVTDPGKDAAEKKENLQEMLRSLQFHRDKLTKELSSLPEDSNLHELFGELGNIDKLIRIGEAADKESLSSGRLKRPRSRKIKKGIKGSDKIKVSSSTMSPPRLTKQSEELQKGRQREKDRKFSKYHVRCTSGSSSSPSPPSKILSTVKSKSERKTAQPPRLVLQNTSTQTTPTVERPQEEAAKEQEQQQPPISPKPSVTTEKAIPCAKIGPCECYLHKENGKGELCQIVIKITEDGKPQICVSPTKLKDRNIVVKTSEEEATVVPAKPESFEVKQVEKPISGEKSKTKLAEKEKVVYKVKTAEKQERQKVMDGKNEKTKNKVKDKSEKPRSSWREYLSQNSTSSTSYMSPPDFTSTQFHPVQSFSRQPHNIAPEVPKQKPNSHLINILRDKPQQFNLQDSSASNQSSVMQTSKSTEPHLRCYIKKLLTMSRTSIDDLPVSSVSSISTPSSSVVNIESNIPLQQLQDMMKHFNINMSALEEFLNCSPDGNGNNVHYNTAESLTLSPTTDLSRSVNSTSNNCNCVDSQTAKSRDVRETSFDDYSSQHYPGVLAAYNKLAENCAKKIENLASMIEKVRLEKISILRSPASGSDKENSTKYLDLPPELRKQNGSSPTSSVAEQEELDRQLLEIDYNFVEQLKKMTPAEIREQFPLSSSSTSSFGSTEEYVQQRDSIDKELMMRYKNLLEGHKSGPNETYSDKPNCPEGCPQKDPSPNVPFVPLLMDIPRLPKLEVPSVTISLQRGNEKSKPPPSKGLTIAKRFNNDINIAPHELSTIAESESLISSRLHRSKTPESRQSSKEASPKQQIDPDPGQELVPLSPLPEPNASQLEKKTPDPTTSENSKPQTSSSDSLPSLPDILAELIKTVSTDADKAINRSAEKGSKHKPSKQIAPKSVIDIPSDSSSELENMEAMLRSLGMGWAVTTLRKTQEALALTSSSSSIDISVTRKEMKLADTRSPTEVSLREVIGRQFLSKLSTSSNGKSEDSSGSPRQFLKELQDLSAIYGSEMSHEKTTRRTSTPVQTSRSAEKSKNDSQPRMTITGESDLSSVKANSDNNCDCVPFYSLNETSIKSKNSSKND